MIIDFDVLKRSDPDMYKIVVDQMGVGLTGEHELQPIEFMGFAPTTRRRLSEWKAQQETAAARTKPVEVLMTLSDGTTQLPLDATPSMLRKASLPQLHDWHRRKKKESPVTRIAGRFAGNIF